MTRLEAEHKYCASVLRLYIGKSVRDWTPLEIIESFNALPVAPVSIEQWILNTGYEITPDITPEQAAEINKQSIDKLKNKGVTVS